jgi:hypothetical protein
VIDPAGFIAAIEPSGGIADHASVLDRGHGNPSTDAPPFHEALV